MSKKKANKDGIIYSTDPNFSTGEAGEKGETPIPQKQRFYIRLDRRHRAGKAVTLIEGFEGRENDLQDLGKKLKNFCGSGGSAKDGVILVQGDQRDKVLQWLIKNGYSNSKKV